MGIILSHVCWGWTAPPPPPGAAGRAAPAQTPLPARRPRRGRGGLGKWASVPSPPCKAIFFPPIVYKNCPANPGLETTVELLHRLVVWQLSLGVPGKGVNSGFNPCKMRKSPTKILSNGLSAGGPLKPPKPQTPVGLGRSKPRAQCFFHTYEPRNRLHGSGFCLVRGRGSGWAVGVSEMLGPPPPSSPCSGGSLGQELGWCWKEFCLPFSPEG